MQWASALQFLVPSYLCVRRSSQNYQIWRGNTCGGGACILASATPPVPRQRSSSCPRFLGFSCLLWRTMTKFGMVTHTGLDVFKAVDHAGWVSYLDL